MIKSITVTNYLGDSIKIDLARPELSGFVVKSITGLGPGTSTINTTELITQDGGLFNSARKSSRNIVISLGFLWKNSIEEVRHLSYKHFPIKKKLTLLIETDTRKAAIDGYVESNEPDIFSKDEGADISIICPDPDFYSAGEDGIKVTRFSHIEPLFEFPFGHESVDEKTLELSVIHYHNEKSVYYEGDAEVGMTIRIHVVGGGMNPSESNQVKNITVYSDRTGESMTINTDKLKTNANFYHDYIESGDEIVICTEKGRKSIKLVNRYGDTYNILSCLTKDSKWFQLAKGNNIFGYTSESGVEHIQLEIENRVAYEGV